MPDTRKENRIYLISLILLAVFAVCFVSAMGFLNYRTTAIDLEEQVIARVEMDAVSGVETAIEFGKSFENYYGMDDVFRSLSEQYPSALPLSLTGKETCSTVPTAGLPKPKSPYALFWLPVSSGAVFPY